MQQMMQKWMTWMKDLGAKGHIKDRGQPLEPAGKLVQGRQKTVTDGPFAEAKDVVGGYTLIQAQEISETLGQSQGDIPTVLKRTKTQEQTARRGKTYENKQ